MEMSIELVVSSFVDPNLSLGFKLESLVSSSITLFWSWAMILKTENHNFKGDNTCIGKYVYADWIVHAIGYSVTVGHLQ